IHVHVGPTRPPGADDLLDVHAGALGAEDGDAGVGADVGDAEAHRATASREASSAACRVVSKSRSIAARAARANSTRGQPGSATWRSASATRSARPDGSDGRSRPV